MKPFYIKYVVGILALTFTFLSCDLEIENVNAPNREKALASDEDILSLVKGATNKLFANQKHNTNVLFECMADVTTSTNNVNHFWGYSDQPRRKINNLTGQRDLIVINNVWNNNFQSIALFNQVLSIVEDGEDIVVDEEDRTNEVLLASYFGRGVGYATLGLIFDKAYIVTQKDADNVEAQTTFKTYKEVFEQGLSDLKKALEIAEEEKVAWTFLTNNEASYDNQKTIQIINSYIARFMIATPRYEGDPVVYSYDEIKGYAQKGIKEDFIATGSSTFNANDLVWAQNTTSSSDVRGAFYLPMDQKIAWMIDPSLPQDYVENPTENILPEPVAVDKRYDKYFYYTTDFGYLTATRRPALFSNIGLVRWEELSDHTGPGSNGALKSYNLVGSRMPFFLKAEIDYIIAECEWKLGNNQAALDIINAGPRATVGLLAPETDVNKILHLLHYEYSIELPYTGKALSWMFMRRNNLLQEGTPLHFPVPANALDLVGASRYEFGSKALADGKNTAETLGWKADTYVY